MSHTTASQFFDGLRASRVLDDARVAELQSRPEAAAGDVPALAQFAQDQGWLTAYQARELREGRGDGLAVSGYRVFDQLADGPSGVTYKALHPALRQPVTLRLLRPDWLGPADTPAEYVARVQAASLAQSPHLAGVLDAGTHGEAPFVVQEFVEGCDLFRLVNEMGALPVGLACEYVRQAAVALQAAHAKGVVHAEVSPQTLVLTPVRRHVRSNGDVTIRPEAGATVKLVELGVTPRRPPVTALTFEQSDRLGPVAFYPPERLTSGDQTPAGDLYGLGASLYFLLTTRPPHPGDTPLAALLDLQQAEPVPVETLRSDLPPAVAELVGRLLARDPAARPSAAEAAEVLFPYGEPAVRPPAPPAAGVPVASETFTQPGVPTAVPVARNLDLQPPADVEPFAEPLDDHPSAVDSHPSADALALPAHSPVVEPISERHLAGDHYDGQSFITGGDEPDGEHGDFGHAGLGAGAPLPPRPRARATGKSMGWIIAGVCLHLTAVTLLVGYLTNWFAFARTPDPEPKIEKEKDVSPKAKKKRST